MGKDWTPVLVRSEIALAVLALPAGVFSDRPGHFVISYGRNLPSCEVLQIAADRLGSESADWLWLFRWALAKSLRLSIRSCCADRGWSRSTMYRHRDAACRTVCVDILTRKSVLALACGTTLA